MPSISIAPAGPSFMTFAVYPRSTVANPGYNIPGNRGASSAWSITSSQEPSARNPRVSRLARVRSSSSVSPDRQGSPAPERFTRVSFVHAALGVLIVGTALVVGWIATRPRQRAQFKSHPEMAILLVLVLCALVVGALLEFLKRGSGSGMIWTLAIVPVLFGLVLLLRRYPGPRRASSRAGMTWTERWQESTFWDRFLWLYLPIAAVIAVTLVLAAGPDSLPVVAVLLPPAMGMTVGVYELNYWLIRRRRRTRQRP